MILDRSLENLQGKVALLSNLIGQENAVCAVARFPLLLCSSETNLKRSFGELVREVEEALESGEEALESGEEALESGEEALESGEEALESGEETLESGEGVLEISEEDENARENLHLESPQKNASDSPKQGWSGAGFRAGSKSWVEARAGEGGGSDGSAGTTARDPMAESRAGATAYDLMAENRTCATARDLVACLVLKYPSLIYYNWEMNTRHKVEYLKRDMGLSIMEVLAFPNFLNYSLDRRIRPRHVALLSIGYELVPYRVMALEWRGERRRENVKDTGAGLGDGLKEVERGNGVEGCEWVEQGKEVECGEEVGGSSGLEYIPGSNKLGTRVTGQQGLAEAALQQARKVCLVQFIQCSDKLFEKRFGIAPIDSSINGS
ncbi:unnamed protein product [Closterium sp. Yama58-4]|nr:unnamed protein product [Closterium sp. Yama58-4]